MVFLWSGGLVTTMWPLWRTYAWAPLCSPLVYLVVNLAYPQPTSRILQVVLLHTFIILQVTVHAKHYSYYYYYYCDVTIGSIPV